MRRIEVPVLVVGAGPVGLMSSLLLSRLGIRNWVVDRRDGPRRAPQAHVVNPRTLEICRSAGLDVEEMRRLATRREDGSHVSWVTTLAGEELGRLPYERQGDENLRFTPTPLLNLPQHRLEPLLLEKLRDGSAAEVVYRHEWKSLSADDRGVTSRVRDLEHADAHEYEVRSRYVLAADGASSRVRTALGIELIGPESLQTFVMIHFAANLRHLVRHRPAILYWTMQPDCAGAFVAHDIDGTWVFMHPIDPVAEPRERFTEEACERIVRSAIGAANVDLAIRDISVWNMSSQVADRYRSGRVFLVGDSAHRFPPSGGMGMNTGIQDAHNLVWKLHAVEAGWCSDEVLATYEIERRPVAQNNADQSLNNAMRMMEVLDALHLSLDRSAAQPAIAETLAQPGARERLQAAIENQQEHFDMFGLQLGLRYTAGAVAAEDAGTRVLPVSPGGGAMGREGSPASASGTWPAFDAQAAGNSVRDFVPTTAPGSRLPHAWVERAGVRCSTLDLIGYDAFTLLVGARGEAWERAADAVDAPLRCIAEGRDFRDDEREWARVREIAPDGALLVRPDQHVAWRAKSLPAEPRAVLASVLSRILPRPGA